MESYKYKILGKYGFGTKTFNFDDDDDEATIALGDPIMNDGDEIIKKTANYEAQCISPLGIFKC